MKRYIVIGKEAVEVTEEVYSVYHQPEWREEKRRKVRSGCEYSYECMLENGFDISAEDDLVDEIVSEKLMIDELYMALAELSDDERNLIYAMFFQEKSEREISKETGVPRKTLSYRRDKVLKKLNHLLEKNK